VVASAVEVEASQGREIPACVGKIRGI
jgi:hypothetical protein